MPLYKCVAAFLRVVIIRSIGLLYTCVNKSLRVFKTYFVVKILQFQFQQKATKAYFLLSFVFHIIVLVVWDVIWYILWILRLAVSISPQMGAYGD